MSSISILGCGWLGLPLAKTLSGQGYLVAGSCRSEEKKQQLHSLGISAWTYQLGESLPTALAKSDYVVLNIPPGRRNFSPERFLTQMNQMIDSILAGPCRHILFVSTTSVYGDMDGIVNETTQPIPNTESGLAHLMLENRLLQTGRASILRLAGLIGPGRHPVKHLAGRQVNKGGQGVNLIHLDDVIQAIIAALHPRHIGQVFHLAATEHPSRADFYIFAAKQAGMSLPSFTDHTGSNSKKVDASKTIERLEITLKYPNPFHMPVEL
ncbi:SDR family oxidoreductase [Aliiglaciecola sp. CAU 1673]|uniref:SDR family oxidoreductase n=1 Tax=Aliiglaciecola sp. CAU 1673 TaxID=3032595 RepID=UPI0023DA9731|nr:SDR family oxidoreductase [Aliiglaciecola sp. CAU 1673]MDF2177777.1 SDR family oxidoreductase [Aliiglaciecola sp. CAU 1673]